MSSDQERFEAVYRATYAAIVAFAMRRVRDPADAADVVAETYLTAWRRVVDLPPGDRARPWLFGIARLVIANHVRGQSRQHRLAGQLRQHLGDEFDRGQPESLDDDHAHVRAAFELLDPSDRELLSLVAWEGLAPSEIAIVMGCSAGAARVRLHRARRRLERLLVGAEVAAIAQPAAATAMKGRP